MFGGFSMKRLIATVAFLAALATGADALAAGAVTAIFAAPVSKAASVVAGGVVWECKESICWITSESSDLDAMPACRALANQFGKITRFGSPSNPFDETKLAKCNTK
jgi:hypothetical protein